MSTRTLSRALLAACATAAALAATSAWSVAAAAGPAAQMAEGWRAIGYATFAVLFGLLAWDPDRSLGLWFAVVANKVLLVLAAATIWSSAVGADVARLWDGGLTVALVVAFLLAAPWRSSSAGRAAVTA